MAVATLTPAVPLRAPRRRDWRVVVGVALMLGTAGGFLVRESLNDDTRAVLVAARELPAGATLQSADLAVARVRVDDALYAAAIPAEQLESLVGRQLAEPAHAQQLLVQPQVSSRPRLGPGQLAVTIPVSAKTAAGGLVRPGDEVRVIATLARGKPESRTVVVLERATVYDVGRDDQLTVVNTAATADPNARPAAQGPLGSLTLVLDDEAAALALAQARWNGELDVALLPPAQR